MLCTWFGGAFIGDCIHQKRMASTPSSAEVCFICLDEGTAESSVELLTFALYRDIPCSCQVWCHMHCWTAYYVKMGGFECPICHSKVVIAPHPPRPQQPIRRERVIIVMRQAADEVQEYRCSLIERTTFICCILIVAISMIVILIIQMK